MLVLQEFRSNISNINESIENLENEKRLREKEQKGAEYNNVLKIKFLNGLLEKKQFEFNSQKFSFIRIGRSKNCEILYKDVSVSRTQCT